MEQGLGEDGLRSLSVTLNAFRTCKAERHSFCPSMRPTHQAQLCSSRGPTSLFSVPVAMPLTRRCGHPCCRTPSQATIFWERAKSVSTTRLMLAKVSSAAGYTPSASGSSNTCARGDTHA